MLFLSGRLCLDFAHSGGEGRYAVFERLHSAGDLREWLRLSPLALEGATVKEKDLAAARRLRRAIWTLANEIRQGKPPSPREVAYLNRTVRAQPLIPLWTPGSPPGYAGPKSAEQAFSTIARDALQLFASEQQIHKCAHPRCPLLFVDSSRPGKRRWCSMERCGNMEKTSRYRQGLPKSGGC